MLEVFDLPSDLDNLKKDRCLMLIQLLVDSLYEVNGHLVSSAVIEVAPKIEEGPGNLIKALDAIFGQMWGSTSKVGHQAMIFL